MAKDEQIGILLDQLHEVNARLALPTAGGGGGSADNTTKILGH